MIKRLLSLLFIFIPIIFSSCHFMDTTGDAPSYIRINPFILTTSNGQGSNSQKIVDAWVYVDEEMIGVFELPATIPVLKAGTHLLEIKPGVLNSGSNQLRIQYPFYTIYKNAAFTLSQNGVTTVTPTTKYEPISSFKYIEDFETGVSLIRANEHQAQVKRDTTKANLFEGTGVGTVLLTDSIDTLECRTLQTFNLPTFAPVFIELNYNTTNDFQVGMVANSYGGTSAQEGISTFAATGGVWKKVYVDVTPFIYKFSDAKDFNVFIGAVKDASQSHTELHFDNIKLIAKQQ